MMFLSILQSKSPCFSTSPALKTHICNASLMHLLSNLQYFGIFFSKNKNKTFSLFPLPHGVIYLKTSSFWFYWDYIRVKVQRSGQNSGVGSLAFLEGIFPTQGSNPGSPIAGGFFFFFLPSEPSGKPQHAEAGSLSLLQGVFPTQEWNQSLLRCIVKHVSWLSIFVVCS